MSLISQKFRNHNNKFQKQVRKFSQTNAANFINHNSISQTSHDIVKPIVLVLTWTRPLFWSCIDYKTYKMQVMVNRQTT